MEWWMSSSPKMVVELKIAVPESKSAGFMLKHFLQVSGSVIWWWKGSPCPTEKNSFVHDFYKGSCYPLQLPNYSEFNDANPYM